MMFTSESVTEGHPDKVADFISDSILDAFLTGDERARVACETLVKSNNVIIAGEITSDAEVQVKEVVRQAIRQVGYTDPSDAFHAEGVQVVNLLTHQSGQIGNSVSKSTDDPQEQGAGDQGIMFGFACDDTPVLLPLPIFLAHRLAEGLAADRKTGRVPWLRPDGKTQVTVEYRDGQAVRVTDVLVSTQHADVPQKQIESYVQEDLAPRVLGEWFGDHMRITVNPSGRFTEGGPAADCGLTGRKIIADTYGGFARHGGGAFSGKDPSKVDRSGAYFCRYVARQVVQHKLARRAEVRVAYAIGRSRPVAVTVETFGSGDPQAAADFVRGFDFKPGSIIAKLRLLRPIYRTTTNYGHFGRQGHTWEEA
jgi:S-adenosylmethionine synthetase